MFPTQKSPSQLNVLAHFAKRNPIFQGSTSDWGSVDRLGMRCGAMVRSIDSSSYHFQVTFGTFGVFLSTPKKAAVCWQDLSQKIDDAIKSISDECYLQLDGCSRLQKPAMLKENFLKLAEVTNSTSLSSSLNNGTYFYLKKSNLNGRTGENGGAISGVGSLTVHPASVEESRFCRFKWEQRIHVQV